VATTLFHITSTGKSKNKWWGGGLVVDVDQRAHPFDRKNSPSPLLAGIHERYKIVRRSCIKEMIFSAATESAAVKLNK